MKHTADLKTASVSLEADFGRSLVHFRAARVTEGLSELAEMRFEVLTTDSGFDPLKLLGTRLRLHVKTDAGVRKFQGTCIAVDFLGTSEGYDFFGIDVRPWLWFLTRRKDTRIFQGKSTPDILKEICDDYGFADVNQRLSSSYEKREYCVQYDETDFDFVRRLLEEEGIYFYFDHSGSVEQLVLTDGAGGHDTMPGKGALKFRASDRNIRLDEAHVFEWSKKGKIVSGKVTLVDYDFTKSATDLKSSAAMEKGKHTFRKFERYEIDADYKTAKEGEAIARKRTESELHEALRFACSTNAPDLAVGQTFRLEDPPKPTDGGKYLVVSAKHHIRSTGDVGATVVPVAQLTTQALSFPLAEGGYLSEIEVAPADQQFRPPRKTPAPKIAGVLTAVVTGPSGSEVYTDKFGRIKVQFHWDRTGSKDENTTCWVRTVVPWSGRGWGMFGVPRIGQEVVIEFEGGNPDRPICTGMVYNDATMPPYAFPDEMTKSGLRTNSTKGGGGYHELVFEDKKGEEFVRMISEKDYFMKVKNNAEIEIGLDKKDNGDLKQTIHRHKTETLKTGDYTFSIEKGSRKVTIQKDHTEEIRGASTTTIQDDTALTVKKGNVTTVLDMGNMATTVKMGNKSTKADLGKITEEAMQAIEMKVGASSIKIEPASVTIKSPMIKIEAQAMVTVKGTMTDIKGDAMLILKGGLTMIN